MPSPADRALALVRELNEAFKDEPGEGGAYWLGATYLAQIRSIAAASGAPICTCSEMLPMPIKNAHFGGCPVLREARPDSPAPNFPALVTAVLIAARRYVEVREHTSGPNQLERAHDELTKATTALRDATVDHAVQEWARATGASRGRNE